MMMFKQCGHAQEMLLQSVDERYGKVFVDVSVFSHDNETEVFVNAAFDAVSAKAQIQVPLATQHYIILKK